jgi:hypothetical protein
MMSLPIAFPIWYSRLVQGELVQKSGLARLTQTAQQPRVNFTRRGDREAEGAALEMPCTVTRTVGSNPTLSACERGPGGKSRPAFILPRARLGDAFGG